MVEITRELFGTDGIRGKANVYPMTAEIALRVGQAVVKVLSSKHKSPKIIIGKDTRLSGYLFENALTAGVISMGGTVILTGPVPTPAVALLTKSLNGDAGIMISASHNPAEDNGIKLFDSDGFKLPDEIEEEIESYVLDGCCTVTDKIGKASRIDHANGRYIQFAKSSINYKSLEGLKIALDCSNGAAYSIAPLVLQELGADVITLCNKPDGLNINLECGSQHPDVVRSAVLGHGCDIGLALDGDADRLIVVDEKGNEVDGDKIMAICALEMKKQGKLKNNAVVATIMSNLGLKKCLEDNGIKLIQTQVGDRYVVEEMRKNNYNLGGEQSGHMIFLDYATTGDGVVSALQLLKIMKDTGKTLSELAKVMTKYPQVLINVEVKGKKPIEDLPETSKLIMDINTTLGSEGRVIVRYSGTQNKARVMVEGKEQKEIENYANNIASTLKKELGE